MGRKRRNNCPQGEDSRRELMATSKSNYSPSKPKGKTRGFNAPEWYALNPQILKDAGSLSFNNAVGGKIDLGLSSFFTETGTVSQSIPGIMRYHFAPVPGYSADNSSAVNLAARDIYAFVRHANSGSANYDSPDLMLYLLAMDSLYMFWNYGKRAYGLMMQYSQYNRYLPSGLVAAAGFDYDDLQSNLANMRYMLNVAAAKINALYVPNVMAYFIRHSWMVSNVYKDSDTLKAQLYLYKPEIIHMLVEQGSTPGLSLDAVQIPDSLTVNAYGILLNKAISLIIESEDMNIMAGDLRKAYGPEKAFLLSGVDENYAVEPVYNEEVLNQMHNMVTAGPIASSLLPTWDVTINTNTNALIFTPTLGDPFHNADHGIMINMPWDTVSPENVMVGSRMLLGYSAAENTFGTEIALFWDIFQFYGDAVNPWKPYVTVSQAGTGLGILPAPQGLGAYIATISQTSQFDWHPIIWTWLSADATTTFTGLIGDVNNYTLIDFNTVKKLHDTAVLSEFGVPINGRI